jgi:protein phosphatase
VQEIPLTSEKGGWLMVASLSDVGCVRENNEDALGVFPGEDPARGTLMLVADGMGGAAAGEVASRLAVDTVADVYFATGNGTPGRALQVALLAANDAIHEKAGGDRDLAGMGTTCTAVAVIGRDLWWAHVGDSRAYLLDGSGLRQLTRDHSLAAEFERQGGGGAPPRARNVLTRCLGVVPEVQVDGEAKPVRLEDGAGLLLCSDGLTNLVDDGEIQQVLSMHHPDGACRSLVQLARERGAPDNVSVAVAKITRG